MLTDDIHGFDLIVLLRRAKNDRLGDGVPKRLQHPPGSGWSPGRAVLLAVLAVRDRFDRKSLLFPTFAGSRLSVGEVSDILAQKAISATGVRVPGRGWRPAAASWLLACGVPREYVAALGGWKSVKSLRNHYVRAVPLEAPLVLKFIGRTSVINQ